jgi:hypothetical protein
MHMLYMLYMLHMLFMLYMRKLYLHKLYMLAACQMVKTYGKHNSQACATDRSFTSFTHVGVEAASVSHALYTFTVLK